LAHVHVRIGIHTGSAVHRDGDLFGRNVAYAARVASLAGGGDVLVSDDTWSRLGLVDVDVVESQEVELKGLAGTHVVHRVVRAGAPEPSLS
ncbi:MAG: adenylate/guanylate cyclase domain-containing protein, partial [Aeromicrobium erythreum]